MLITFAYTPNLPWQSNPRAAKKRADLLASFDTLASHLQTTFTALSTALARNEKSKTRLQPREGDHAANGVKVLARAYLTIVLGPSASSGKAKVVFAVDGLEVKLWGERDDSGSDMSAAKDAVESESDDDDDDDSESEESDKVEDIDGEESSGEAESESESSDDDVDSVMESDTDLEGTTSETSTDSIIDDLPPSPPGSRSPSPASSLGLSRSPSPLSDAPTPKPHVPAISFPGLQPTLETPSYAAEQHALRAAELLLSRTLASACAEEDGQGMACELGNYSRLSFLICR